VCARMCICRRRLRDAHWRRAAVADEGSRGERTCMLLRRLLQNFVIQNSENVSAIVFLYSKSSSELTLEDFCLFLLRLLMRGRVIPLWAGRGGCRDRANWI